MEEKTQLLKETVVEIKSLRAKNAVMAARLEMFDSMMLLFTSSPKYHNQGMSPDLVWKIEKYIEDNQDKIK